MPLQRNRLHFWRRISMRKLVNVLIMVAICSVTILWIQLPYRFLGLSPRLAYMELILYERYPPLFTMPWRNQTMDLIEEGDSHDMMSRRLLEKPGRLTSGHPFWNLHGSIDNVARSSSMSPILLTSSQGFQWKNDEK